MYWLNDAIRNDGLFTISVCHLLIRFSLKFRNCSCAYLFMLEREEIVEGNRGIFASLLSKKASWKLYPAIPKTGLCRIVNRGLLIQSQCLLLPLNINWYVCVTVFPEVYTSWTQTPCFISCI